MANATYQRYKSQGLCVLCGKDPVPGKLRCESCAERAKKITREWAERNPGGDTRSRRRKQGLCECGDKPPEGQKLCDKCRDKLHKKQKKYAAKNRAAGLCTC